MSQNDNTISDNIVLKWKLRIYLISISSILYTFLICKIIHHYVVGIDILEIFYIHKPAPNGFIYNYTVSYQNETYRQSMGIPCTGGIIYYAGSMINMALLILNAAYTSWNTQ